MGITRRRALASASALVVSATLPGLGQAQTATPGWPSKPVRLVVGFPPGGLTDAYARQYAEQLSARIGQPVVVENKPGAASAIAIDSVVKANDGHTFLVTTSGTVWQNRVFMKKLPFDLEKDLVPITLFPSGALVFGATASLPIKNMAEFVDYAKKNKVSMGTYAAGSLPHMVVDHLNKQFGLDIQVVHYRGEAPMWIDVASGQVQAAIGSYQAFANMQSKGSVKALGVTGRSRSPKMPDMPLVAEQSGFDFPLYRLDGFLPLMAPRGTPAAVIQRMSEIAVEAGESEKARQIRESFAIPDKPLNLADSQRRSREDSAVWIKHAVDLGITLD